MNRIGAELGVLALTVLLGPLSSYAWTVTGRVTNASGQGIAGVDLDFEDLDSGEIIFTPNDDTDVNGFYTTTVPTGTYRIFFNPPIGSNYIEGRLDDQVINMNRTINMTLQQGVFVSGYVRDTNGVGLIDVDLNFYNSATGENMGYTNDNTDASGFYNVLVDANMTFDILYRPPLGDPHVAYQANDVVVGSANIVRPDVVLASGFLVTGQVIRKGTNNPVVGADIDAEISATGASVTLGFDNTDGNGFYTIVLTAGTYDIIAMPPSGQGLAGEVITNIVVSGNRTAPTIELPVGFTLSGSVRNNLNAPVADANLDAIDVARGVEIPTTGDHTDAAGNYSVVLGAGTYNLLYFPPPGMPAAASVVRNRVISGNGTQPTVFLLPGFVVSGTVTRGGVVPVAGSDIDAIQMSDGFEYPTLNDDSAANGSYSIRVPGGTYRFVAGPPAGSGFVADTVVAAISANTVINFVLFDPAATGVDEAAAANGTASVWMSEAAPNPTRGTTRVRFRVGPAVGSPNSGSLVSARVSVYSAEGRLVRVLVDGSMASGEQMVEWDGNDASGQPVSSGAYLLRLESGGGAATTKALLLR